MFHSRILKAGLHDLLSDGQKKTLEYIYQVVEGLNNRANGYIKTFFDTIKISATKPAYKLYDEILKSILPDEVKVNALAAAGSVDFTLENTLSLIIGLVFFGNTQNARINTGVIHNSSRFGKLYPQFWGNGVGAAQRINDLSAWTGITFNNSLIGKLNFAVQVTAWIGLKYIQYVNSIFAHDELVELEHEGHRIIVSESELVKAAKLCANNRW